MKAIRGIFLAAVLAFALPAFADEVTGTLTVIHADYPDGTATHQWVVKDSAGKDHKVNLDYRHKHLVGKKVKIKGKRKKTTDPIDVEQIDVLGLAPPQAVTGGINVIYIPVSYSDTPFAFTAAQVQSAVANVAAWYSEASYGKQTINATITPTVSIPIARASSCDYSAVGTATDTAAAGYNVAGFSYRVYLIPNSPCGWLGLAYVGYGRAWINGTLAGQVISHETGHNFGLYHAGATSGTGAGIGVSEYGDIDNTMGNYAQHHPAAPQKLTMSWLTTTQVATYASGTQTYTLAPYARTGGALYAVKIPTANANRTFSLEYRQPAGFDDAICANSACVTAVRAGVQLRLVCPCESNSGYDDTQYLSNLAVGDVYTDAPSSINISVVSADASGAVVRVSTAAAPPPPPPTPDSLVNGSFEIPVLSANGYAYSPTGSTWTFAGGVGLQSNGSAWGAPNTPDGRQTAFIQNAGSTLSQSVSLGGGNYTLAFKLARRSWAIPSGSFLPIKVSVDGITIGTATPSSASSFSSHSFAFTATAGAHVIAFMGTSSTGGDVTTFVDAVTLTGSATPPPPPTPTPTTTALGVVVSYTATVTGNNPTGTVRFGTVSNCQAVPLVASTASCSGPYVAGVIAYYSGDANNAPSQSP